ncbi:MAG: cobalt-zinc-cadmium resistance protein CzcD, partial [Steroidobacteraceae bacterium]|nr:cobalt-zinc-cadmium resistance protein CzcD [Steroidobacteraceae bacterium]
MAMAAAVALCGNLACFGLLYRFRADDMNMRSVWLCSRNDLVNNGGVLVVAAAATPVFFRIDHVERAAVGRRRLASRSGECDRDAVDV